MKMKKTIQYTTAHTFDDLTQILSLQNENLPQNISPEELENEGFVTVQHDLDLLSKIAGSYTHAVAKFDGKVIGYALVMERACSKDIPVLIPMFEQIDKIIYNGKPLSDTRFFVMGQVCIKKGFRGQGVFKGLYEQLRQNMKSDFDYIITDISIHNKRSLRAHEKIGFKPIQKYIHNGEEWVIVLLRI